MGGINLTVRTICLAMQLFKNQLKRIGNALSGKEAIVESRKSLSDRIKTTKPHSLSQVITLCAWDDRLNFFKKVTPEDFWKHVFVEPPRYAELAKIISNNFHDPVAPRSLFVLSGYAGTGKTTFIHYFQRLCKDVKHIYVDLDSPLVRQKRLGLSDNERSSIHRAVAAQKNGDFDELSGLLARLVDPDPPISSFLRAEICSKAYLPYLRKAITRIKAKLHIVQDHLTRDSRSLIKAIPYRPTDEQVKALASALSATDLLLAFLLTLSETTLGEKCTYLYFDNLDRVELEYLSQNFKDDFTRALDSMSLFATNGDLYEQPFYFYHKFKILFCLRDASYSTMDVQHHGFTRNLFFAKRLCHFSEGSLYPNIAQRRLRLAREVFSDNEEIQSAITRAEDALAIFLPHAQEVSEERNRIQTDPSAVTTDSGGSPYKDTRYFGGAISPLFNFDLKKLLPIILNVTDPTHSPASLPMHPTDGRMQQFYYLSSAYARGGNLIHTISHLLKNDEYAENIFLDPEQEIADRKRGHCLKARMVLAVISNLVTYDPSRHRVLEEGICSVMAVVDALAGLYSPREVIHKIEDLFLTHRKGWVHLLSIEGFHVLNRGDLIRGSDSSSLDAIEFYHDNHVRRARLPKDLRLRLSSTKVQITPAGFSFLKHLLLHFEFYSNFTSNQESLFSAGITKVENHDKKGMGSNEKTKDVGERKGTERYLFEDITKNVYKLLSTHVKSMETFYQNVIRKKVGIEPEAYRKSNMCFKYIGKMDAARRSEGYFHAFRLINSMVIHIDQFRSYLLSTDLSDEVKHEINQILSASILGFARLHKYCPDPSSREFLKIYNRLFQRIKESKFKDPYLSLFTEKEA